MRSILLITLLLCALCTAHAQSIAGNLHEGTGRAALGYGNVDIFRGDELIASVLTDRYGNFNVRLDTGEYKCVVNYDGYESETRIVRVKADEKVDFAVKEDKSKPKRERHMAAKAIAVTTTHADYAPAYAEPAFGGSIELASPTSPATMYYTPTMATPMGTGEMPYTAPTYGFDAKDVEAADEPVPLDPPTSGSILDAAEKKAASHGVLTAGEVNDFSKWTMWQDIAGNTLSALRDLWATAPTGRYTLDLQNKSGLPIADAVVRLKKKDGTELYSARTDNTGKAELWATLDAKAEATKGRLLMEVEYNGQTTRIDNVKPFERSVNRLALDVPCGPSDNVDVAFVVDATGSMQDELDFLTAEMNDIIFRSKSISDQLNFRFANVFYRDIGAEEEYATRSMDFSRVLSASVNFISDQKADGGGDVPEAVDLALDSAINHLSWSADARARILFLILDAGPHITPEVQQKIQSLTKQAANKGIRIVPITASGTGKATEYLMRTLALGTNGTYTFLTNHSGVGSDHIEPTTDHYDVESLNDLLVRVLKSYTYMPGCDQQIPDLDLNYPDSLVLEPVGPDSTGSAGINESTGLPTDSATIRWSYYPNPTTGIVNLTADVDIAELYVTDLSGKVMQMVKGLQAAKTVQIDLSAYATGIYLIRYPYGKAWLSGKVVMQRS
ncbi:MAG: T9SS type A sorting domain-containing protein [Flavobacteriales bacterium]|nr:T9SS type A sorting domain-containing protein [Flavobacteriales bacterium]